MMSVTFTQRQGDGNDGNRNEACELASVVKCYERLIKLLLLMTFFLFSAFVAVLTAAQR